MPNILGEINLRPLSSWAFLPPVVVLYQGMISASFPVQVSGGCHCQAVRFDVDLPSKEVDVYSCNCSMCRMKQNAHFVVPEAQMHLKVESEANLNLYTYGTHTAKHLFCKMCGICAFYRPRSNPKGYAITFNCLDDVARETILTPTFKTFDGLNWEEQIKHSDITEKA